jgi:hypothetical protein
MNTTNAVVLTGLVVVAGHWANGKKLSVRLAIGTGGLVLFLSALNESSPDLAGKFAVLILLAAVFMYAPGVVKKAGLTK